MNTGVYLPYVSEVAIRPLRSIRAGVVIGGECCHDPLSISASTRGIVPDYLYGEVTSREVCKGVGVPCRAGPSRRDSRREPRARRVGAICPAYCFATGKRSVNNFRAEGRAPFLGQVSRETEEGFPLVYGPQSRVGHY